MQASIIDIDLTMGGFVGYMKINLLIIWDVQFIQDEHSNKRK